VGTERGEEVNFNPSLQVPIYDPVYLQKKSKIFANLKNNEKAHNHAFVTVCCSTLYSARKDTNYFIFLVF
jgi:hypothetical protein